MSTYLVIVLLLIPSAQGGAPLERVLMREVIPASSPAVCQAHAERRAEEQRRLNAELIRRTSARAVGMCLAVNPEPTT